MKTQFNLKGGLSLNKETLSRINEQQMKAIAGGARGAGASQVGPPPTETDNLVASDCCSYANTACC